MILIEESPECGFNLLFVSRAMAAVSPIHPDGMKTELTSMYFEEGAVVGELVKDDVITGVEMDVPTVVVGAMGAGVDGFVHPAINTADTRSIITIVGIDHLSFITERYLYEYIN